MDDRARRIPFLNHLLLLLIAGMVIYLVVDFGQQVDESHDQQKVVQELEADIAVAKAETARLESELDYALSDDAVEEFARSMGWARENEVSVVVGTALPESASPAKKDAAAAGDPEAYHQAWWDLFFGDR